MSALYRAQQHIDADNYGVFFDFACCLQNACENAELFILSYALVFHSAYNSWEDLLTATQNLRNDTLRDSELKRTFLVNTQALKNFREACGDIRSVRNVLAHGPEVAVYLDQENKEELRPRIGQHENYLWKDIPQDERETVKYFVSEVIEQAADKH